MASSTLRVVRPDTSPADMYDKHVAVLSIDGQHVGELALGATQDFPVEAGQHEVGVRLSMNFGTRSVTVTVPDNGTTTVTYAKARSAKDPHVLVTHRVLVANGQLKPEAQLTVPRPRTARAWVYRKRPFF